MTILNLLPWASLAQDSACEVFNLYQNFEKVGTPALEGPTQSKSNYLREISSLPGHSSAINNKMIEKSEEELRCLHHHLFTDTDGDGIRDWQIISQGELLDKLTPLDSDWDNDGILNILDSQPFVENKISWNEGLPTHLLLDTRDSKISQLQLKIFEDCNTLAINKSDNHTIENLFYYYELCKKIPQTRKKEPILLYAFASHAISSKKACYYHSINAISIPGVLDSSPLLAHEKIQVMAHELGHYFSFNFLNPKDLLSIFNSNTTSTKLTPENQTLDFYHPSLLQAIDKSTLTYQPSDYSLKNIHEWMSESFAQFLMEKINWPKSNVDKSIAAMPISLELWIEDKLSK